MKTDEYLMMSVSEDHYEKVTNSAGVRTTVCKNRFEILCQDKGEINEQHAVHELRAWIAKRRQEEMRDAGDLPKQLP